MKILVVDVGGTKVKLLLSGEHEPRKAPSGKDLTPQKLVETVQTLAEGWDYEAITLGYPGLVGDHGPRAEPGNLAPGWIGFDFGAAFDCPVKLINDAAMQALGSYAGGRMLFLGLGTGLGSTLIADNVIVPLELGNLRYRKGATLFQVVGRRGFQRLGQERWREVVMEIATELMKAFVADYVVLGGGNAKKLDVLPPGFRLGHNQTAFRGGFRLWGMDIAPTQSEEGRTEAPAAPEEWRLV